LPDSRLRFDQRILLLALAAGFPAALVALVLLWTGDYTPKVQWTLTVFLVGVWTGCSFSVRHRVVLPLQTLSNLLAALRESDFSIRARGASGDDPLGAQIALAHDRRADVDRVIGHADVERLAVGVAVDGDRSDAHLAQSADDAHGDLAAVRDQNLAKHTNSVSTARALLV